MRDITLEDTFRHQFTTRAFATGIPTVLAGTPVLSVLEENNAAPITAGVSVSVDRASVAGLNEATIIATAANGYESGKSYAIYISTGTVGGTSVIGEVVGQFTIELAAAFIRLGAPAGASVSADIAVIEGQTDDIGVAGAGLTAINLPNQTMDIVGDITGNLSGSIGSNIELGPAEVNAECDTAISDAALATAANLATVDTEVDKVVTAVITNAAGVDIAGDIIAVKAETALIVADTDELQGDWVGGGRLDLILDARMAEASIDTTAGAIDNVTLVATTTTNTDVRGTDSAALASVLGTPAGADIAADIAAVKADTVIPEKNQAFSNIYVLMVDDTDHVTPKTGLTLTVQRSLDGAAFGAVTGTAAEISNGMYQFDASAADMNGDTITFRFSGTNADDTFLTIVTR